MKALAKFFHKLADICDGGWAGVLWRWRRRAAMMGTRHRCPLRPVRMNEPDRPDAWMRVGPDRTCTYCGSMKPEDFLAIVEQVDGTDPFISLNTRRDKIYIHRIAVRHAHEGAIKIYAAHLEQYAEHRPKIEAALKLSWDRQMRPTQQSAPD